MKALTTIIAFTLFFNVISKNSSSQGNRTISDQEVLDTANANLDNFRETIEPFYEEFGFKTIEELNNIKPGAPYEFVLLHPDFINDTLFTEGKNYFYNENKGWHVPVICDGTFRCIMTIFYSNDSLKYGGAGGAKFAEFFENCEKRYSIPKNGKRYFMLPDIIYMCEFIVLLDSANTYRFYPMQEPAISDNACSKDASYNRHNSMKNFFDTYKSQVYTSINDLINASLKFEIYPNPAFNNANMRGYVPPHTKEANYKIYDINGKELFKQQLSERGRIDIELNEIAFSKSGVYICKIILDGNETSRKIFVAK
ncbi:MAG: T9SS type A sorting domain-containing protein [Prolixibacteraceae bacterium]|nr:T9SS type A sorting domain-containing protein [Prolixibacteraceae bacterium]